MNTDREGGHGPGQAHLSGQPQHSYGQSSYGQSLGGHAPYGQVPHPEGTYGQDPRPQNPNPNLNPDPQDPYPQDPYPQDPYPQDPYGQDPHGGHASGPWEPPGPRHEPGHGSASPYPSASASPYPFPSDSPSGLGSGIDHRAAPRRRNRATLVAAVTGGTVLVLVLAAALIGLGSTDGADADKGRLPAQSAAAKAAKAAQHLATVPALQFNGSFSSDGATVQAQLSVTRAGTAMGTVTVDGADADVVVIDGKTFIKAGREFWRAHGGPAASANPDEYAGRWSRAPAAALDLDIPGTLGPIAIMQRLRSAADAPSGPRPSSSSDSAAQSTARLEYFNGTPVIKVATINGHCYLSRSEPHKLLRVAATGAENYQFDVTEPVTAEVINLYAELREAVKRLAGARDPSVHFVTGPLKFDHCNNNVAGCTLRVSATRGAGAGAGAGKPYDVRAVMSAKIVAGGRVLGRCKGDEPVEPGKSVQLSCTVTGSGWSGWMRKARSTPGTHRYTAEAEVLAEAFSPAAINRLLKQLDREQQAA